MKNKHRILPIACCVALLGACAANQQVSEAPWLISPSIKTSSPATNASGMYKLGRYYQGQQRDNLAIEAYQKALALDHGFVEAYNGLGVIYSRQGKYQEAIEEFRTALNYASGMAHLYNNLGYAYYLQGQYAEAVSQLKYATALDPSNQHALNNLGLAYAKAGSKGESVQAFTQAAKVEDESTNAAAIAVSSPHEPTMVSTEPKVNTEPKSGSLSDVLSAQIAIQKPELQMLTLPKSQGIIRPAFVSQSVPIVDSRVKLVEVSPNVYELHTASLSGMPAQVTNALEAVNLTHTRVEVSNGNGVTGMAAKVGKFLLTQGYPVPRLTNQKPFNISKSQIQYRDGYHAQALLLKGGLPESPELIQRSDLRAGVGVRLLLGKDLTTDLAYFENKQQKFQLALTANMPKH